MQNPIVRVEVRNFKSYEHAVFEPLPVGVTSIVGPSNSGKSNLFKAVHTAVSGSPWPVSWLRRGTDEGSVSVLFQDGTRITRYRTRNAQRTEIEKGGEVRVFEGVKDAAPFLREASGFHPVLLDPASGEEDLNFTQLWEGPFLIGNRPDAVQRKVLSILNILHLQSLLAVMVREIKTSEADLAKRRSDLESLRSDLRALEDKRARLEELDVLLRDAQRRFGLLSALAEARRNLFRQKAVLERGDETLSRLERSLSILRDLEDSRSEARKRAEGLACLVRARSSLNEHRNRLDRIEDEIGRAESDLNRLRGMLDVCPACGQHILRSETP